MKKRQLKKAKTKLVNGLPLTSRELAALKLRSSFVSPLEYYAFSVAIASRHAVSQCLRSVRPILDACSHVARRF